MSKNPIVHLNQVLLARRWNVSPRTLERWRWLGQGPCYLKVGGRVLYRLEDVDAFEARSVQSGRAANSGCGVAAVEPVRGARP